MPEQAPIPTDDLHGADPTAPEAGGVSLLAKVKVLAFVTVVIAAECVLAWLYLPSASKTAAMAEAAIEAKPPVDASTADKTDKPDEDLASLVEVDLETFCVAAYQPVSGTTLRADFHLWGMVDQKDHDEFVRLMEDHHYRFREQIQYTIRSAEITDLTDARMALIKRKALERANRTIGKPLLRAVIFDDFSLVEQ
jgi:hypothetical protein